MNPGFNFSRSGGTNSTGIKLEDANLLGTGAVAEILATRAPSTAPAIRSICPTITAFNSWTAVRSQLRQLQRRGACAASPSRGRSTRSIRAARPPSPLLDDTQVDPLYDRGQIVDQFQDQHELVQAYYGWSAGLQERLGAALDRRPHLRRARVRSRQQLRGHDQPAARRPALHLPLHRVGPGAGRLPEALEPRPDRAHRGLRSSAWPPGRGSAGRSAGLGSSSSALIMNASANKGFREGNSTLLLYSDFSGRLQQGTLQNGILDVSARYYVEQSKNWLFFSTLTGDQGLEPRPRQPDSPRRRQRAARLPAALPGRHGAGAVQRRAALLHRLVPVPAVPGGRRDLLRHGPHLGQRAARAAEPGTAEGRRLRPALR